MYPTDYDPEDHYDGSQDRYAIYDHKTEEYKPVWEATWIDRRLRYLVYDWQHNIAGPFYRLRRDIARHWKHCKTCGKRDCGPYWFSDTCEACLDQWFEDHDMRRHIGQWMTIVILRGNPENGLRDQDD